MYFLIDVCLVSVCLVLFLQFIPHYISLTRMQTYPYTFTSNSSLSILFSLLHTTLSLPHSPGQSHMISTSHHSYSICYFYHSIPPITPSFRSLHAFHHSVIFITSPFPSLLSTDHLYHLYHVHDKMQEKTLQHAQVMTTATARTHHTRHPLLSLTGPGDASSHR